MDFFITGILFHPNTCTSCAGCPSFVAGTWISDRFGAKGRCQRPEVMNMHSDLLGWTLSSWSLKGTVLWLIGGSIVLTFVNSLFGELMNHYWSLEFWDEQLATLYTCYIWSCQVMACHVRPYINSLALSVNAAQNCQAGGCFGSASLRVLVTYRPCMTVEDG